ncbi:ankyrin-1-like [Trichogramma pretiosum]|uniref:ankyrin-1-like n=1 Tax=Trichogramma pretiosum TaxID=7493 RepID=UPI000C71A6B9|nr:ankyrin-1-like [Trichogramma pretiosum]
MFNPESLHDAVECEKLEVVESLLKNGTNPNIVNEEGMSPIHLVCYRPSLSNKQLDIAQILIRYKADLNLKDKYGNSPMMNLFQHDHDYNTYRLDMLKLLLENNAEVPNNYKTKKDLDNQKNSKLIEQIDMLIKNSNGLSFYSFPNESPLHLAVHFRALETVELLLKTGIDSDQFDDESTTPLNRICNLPKLTDVDIKMIRLLIQYRADVNAKGYDVEEDDDDGEEMEYYSDFESDSETEFPVGNTPMINLFYRKQDYELRKEALKLLLDGNADFTLSGRGGRTILDVLLQKELNTNIIEIIELLIKYGMDLNKVNKINGMTPIYYPLIEREPEKVEFLLKKGADPNVRCFLSWTPLNFICVENELTHSDVDMIKLLIQYKADVNIKDENDNSAVINLFSVPRNRRNARPNTNDFNTNDQVYRMQVFELLKENNADLTGLDWYGE